MKWFLSFLLLLSSCAPVEPIAFKGPKGNPAYSMRCSGMGRTLAQCYKKAGELCPAGYTIVDRASGVVGLPVRGGMMLTPHHSLAIECSALSAMDTASQHRKGSTLEVSVMPVLMPPILTAPVRRLAVVPLSSETNPRLSSSLDLTLNFLRTRHPQMVIVERERLDALLDEAAKQYAANMSDQTVVRLGRLSGADTLLTYNIEPLTDKTIVSIAVNGGVLAGTAEFRLLDAETGVVLFRQGVIGNVSLSSPGPDRAYPPDSIRELHRFVTNSAASYALAAMAAAFGDNPLGLIPNVGATSGGVVVTDVLHGGPAHGAGLRRHDRIMSVNGSPFSSWTLPITLPAILSVERDGKSQEINIQIYQ